MPSTDVSTIARIGHDEAMVLTQTEFDRAVALLRALSPSDWAQPTDCDRWTVRAVALHLLGTAEANASLPEQIRQMRTRFEAEGVGRQPALVGRRERIPDRQAREPA